MQKKRKIILLLASAAVIAVVILTITRVYSDGEKAYSRKIQATKEASSLSSHESIILKWSEVPEAEAYEVRRSTEPNGDFETVGRSKTTEFKNKVDDVDQHYYYRIYTVKDGMLSNEYASCDDEAVRTMYYQFTFKEDTELREENGLKKTLFKKGDTFTATSVTRRLYYNFYYEGRKYIVDKSLTEDRKIIQYNPEEHYSEAEAISYIEERKLTSKTDYLIWVNTYTQREYIFKGKNGDWKVIRDWHVSTGSAKRPSTIVVTTIRKKQENLHDTPYWNRCGHFSIHGSKDSWNLDYPRSSGCIRNTNDHAKWIYDNIPVGTTVVVY